jgi:hypothetical protein
MFDGRIYRTGLVVVALAVLVLGFSFQNQSSPLSSSLAPDAFNGQNVSGTISRLAHAFPNRAPGSAGDYDLALEVSRAFRASGFSGSVTTDTFKAETADGSRSLENVLAVRPGIQSGSVVVVAARDARGSPSAAALSGTATEIELARDLAGETLHRTVVLASTSGSAGTAGTIRLASTLAGPVDAVIVLGDLASSHVRQPIVVPWSSGQRVAPPVLRNTAASELSQQAALNTSGTSLFGQFAHLAFPLTISNQAPFGPQGIPAVMISLSGERGPGPDAALAGPAQLNTAGRAVLSTITALDSAPKLAAPSAYVLLSGKLVPGWAISLFVLALIVPVVMATVDGLARARRHGHVIWRWLAVVLGAGAPFVLAGLFVLAARLTGALAVAPPGPSPAGSVPMGTGGVVVAALAAVIAMTTFFLLRPTVLRFAAGTASARRAINDSREGVVAALLIVMCLVVLAIWAANPFAALLAVPALHLWLLAANPDLRLRVPVRAILLLLGLAPLGLLVAYYAVTLGYSAPQVIWVATLLLAGHAVSLLAVLEWSLFLGCAIVTGGVLLVSARESHPEPVPVTVRGPITYAGPGSLGGTESALRR